MKVEQIRHLIRGFRNRFEFVYIGDKKEINELYVKETVYLAPLTRMAKKGIPGEQLLTPVQLQLIKTILHERDHKTRNELTHYTKTPSDPINLYYIQLAEALGNALDQPLINMLLDMDNEYCPNLGSIAYFSNKKNSPLATCVSYYSPAMQETRLLQRSIADDDHRFDYSAYQDRQFFPPQLHGLYFYENTLYSVRGLWEINQLPVSGLTNASNIIDASNVFSTYLSCDRTKRSAVPVAVFKALRDKTEPFLQRRRILTFGLAINQQQYSHPYELIHDHLMPTWHTQGQFNPQWIFELIQIYLDAPVMISTSTSVMEFWKQGLKQWCDQVVEKLLPIHACCLYGQLIDPTQNRYFLDVLIELLAEHDAVKIESLIWEIAVWIARVTPRRADWDCLQPLFDHHWDRIRDKPGDYFSLSMSAYEQSAYVKLAKKLSAEGIAPLSYQCRLVRWLEDMPIDLSLPVCVLTQSGRNVIDLRKSQRNYDARRGFLVISDEGKMRLFTDVEKERVIRNVYYRESAWFITTVEKSTEPLFLSTVHFIREYVNKTFACEGEKDEKAQCVFLFKEFYTRYRGLNQDERARLGRKWIERTSSYPLCVSDYLALIVGRENDPTISLRAVARNFIPLLINYNPYTPFCSAIEALEDRSEKEQTLKLLASLRRNADKHVYRDYDDIEEDEAVRRLALIATSLLSESFEDTSSELRVGKETNKGPACCAKMIERIRPVFYPEGFLMARFHYSCLIESIEQKDFLSPLSRQHKTSLWSSEPKTSTSSWLEKVRNGSLIGNRRDCQVWFHPMLFLENRERISQILARKNCNDRDMIQKLYDRASHRMKLAHDDDAGETILREDIFFNVLWRTCLRNLLKSDANDAFELITFCNQAIDTMPESEKQIQYKPDPSKLGRPESEKRRLTDNTLLAEMRSSLMNRSVY
jgi:hypothetical protein